MCISASFVSSHSPFALIHIESNVGVQVFNKCNELILIESKVKCKSKENFISQQLNTHLVYIHSIDFYTQLT